MAHPVEQPAVFDDALSHRACGVLSRANRSFTEVTDFFRKPPARGGPGRVTQRVVRRLEQQTDGRVACGRFFWGYCWLEGEELHGLVIGQARLSAEAALVLGERGVPVLNVDVREPLLDQAAEVEGLLKSL